MLKAALAGLAALAVTAASAPLLGAEGAPAQPKTQSPPEAKKQEVRPILQDMQFTENGWPVIHRIERKWYEQENRYAIGRRLLTVRTVCNYLKRTGPEPAQHCRAAMSDHDFYQPVADFTYFTAWISSFAFVGGVIFWAGGNSSLALYSGLTMVTMLGVQIAISPWRESREANLEKALDAYHKLPPPDKPSQPQQLQGLKLGIHFRF